jgi:hypothetical protein
MRKPPSYAWHAAIPGSSISLDEVLKRVSSNWYLEAEEAKNPGLIEAVL